MNSERFSVQSSLGANYLNIRLDGDAGLDEIAIRVISNDCPDFIIPFRITNINEEITLKYKLMSTVALKYVELRMTKKELVKLYLSLITPFVKGKDWFLDYHNICIDMQYVFMERRNTLRIVYIYIPDASFRNTDEEIMEFFKVILRRSTVTDDSNFQLLLYRYFDESNVTLQGFYNIIKEAAKNEPSQNVSNNNKDMQNILSENPKLQNVPQNELSTSGAIDKLADKEKSVKNRQAYKEPCTSNTNSGEFGIFGSNVDDKAVKAIFGEDKKQKNKEKHSKEKKSGGFWGGGKKKKTDMEKQLSTDSVHENNRVQQRGFVNNYVLGESSGYNHLGFDGRENEVTEMYVEGENMSAARLELQSSAISGAPQSILLNFDKPDISIGRISSDVVKPDIAFSPEFKRIGRHHARIEKRNEDYYIIDLGSANHTLLNGQMLVPNQPYLISEGSELCFTDSTPVKYRFYK